MSFVKPDIVQRFFSFIGEDSFPCVGAKTALTRGQVYVKHYDNIECKTNETDILASIHTFVESFDIEQDMYSSLVVTFEQPDTISEYAFDKLLWEKLQRLHEVDACLKPWDSKVSSDPQSAQFSLSLGGKGFFVIGLHPNASRKSRRFSHPTIVFNLHEQFELLREQHKFDAFREHIRKRDTAYCGSKNPLLANHGDSSEVYQYSGKTHTEEWECPFKHVKNKTPQLQ
ncbi:YqcI/YcgG family protein [Alteromonas sp. IB21]|uniref:guanitoxin biosynthesis heme-dependent pre-guanitoxin N-hydroxylase GntA n=1 Tax=Alteromonas sp. IB21 TaxID=2779369 RepID=UPI0018E84016|nr:guanitoxin biosynthesis heme-dependent pre-guanitoxin N-hydroxylase GntA [Alteromonas sp. IB21]MBJ2130575.1 YqcI/YcgG family protein [Alteromonas sp. IB21]|tara:strand:- start:1458 stop:2141 length:684 start_codon:yes stop_codon:yes gene_type:complete